MVLKFVRKRPKLNEKEAGMAHFIKTFHFLGKFIEAAASSTLKLIYSTFMV